MKSAIIVLFLTFTNLAFASASCYYEDLEITYENLDKNGSTVVCAGEGIHLNLRFNCILNKFPKGFTIENINSRNEYTCVIIKTRK